ncbi:macrolide 2'-phosphotransferase [Virgibacillus profundi]|uniref:Macrolide 2'-phosphotransferase n=1 Tax=Virgibacillus profundi TaxID=2024555 RepID=A0A2A2IFY7_9BACI|nr:macrolide 2'-phosphotransferase [Virgibacillus profundi]PAV30452.1 macrolide 2'-phosphotransferase [Virgibacillus profundi]PXY54624.1 macrolide 2'-phosphotransferase [Virgibacillus profundi]
MTLSNEQVIEIANKNGLEIDRNSLKYNESGVDFQVVFAADSEEENWVLRFPRRKDVVPRAKKEKDILDLIGEKISVQAPRWEIFSAELIGYKLLKGIPVGTIDPEAKAYVWEIDEKNIPAIFHETLGSAMVELHKIDHEEAKRAGLSVQSPGDIKNSMQKRMEKVKAEFGVSEELWHRWQEWLANDELWPKRTALIHGDLHPGHILIDKDTRVTGFIDWTEARVDDPGNDFVSQLLTLGEDALKELIDAYGNAGGYVWPNMFEHIVELSAAYPVPLAEFAMISGMKEYEEMAKQALGVEK